MSEKVDIDRLLHQLEAGWLPTEYNGKFSFDYETANDLTLFAAEVIMDILRELDGLRDLMYDIADMLEPKAERTEAEQKALDIVNSYIPIYTTSRNL